MQYRHLQQRGTLSAAGEVARAADQPARRRRTSRSETHGGRTTGAGQQVDLTGFTVPAHILQLVPASVAHENNVLPLDFDGETITFACCEPDDIALADKLRFVLAKNVRFVLAEREEIQRAISRYYGPARAMSDSMLQQFTDTAVDAMESDEELASAALSARPTSRPRAKRGGLAADWRSGAQAAAPAAARTRGFSSAPQIPAASDRGYGMWFYTVEEGQRVLMTRRNGTKEMLVGPKRAFRWHRRFEQMPHHVAHPGEFLIIRFRDGHQEHLPGPVEAWFDPREHEGIATEQCVQIAAKEAVVVYSRNVPQQPAVGEISRRVVYGPALFVPQPGEWLHTFSWHASKGGHQGVEKIPNALVFQKLWLMPDQMYHDVRDVRTADNAVLTVRLMVFFELVDVERMLEATHDPIGDFVNATTADVVEFTGRHDFEAFKRNTDKLNDLATYKTLTSRAQQIGYRINNVVYRGYGAAESLQKMHDQAIEARTRLQLERATEEQTQQLEDYRLQSQLARASKRRAEQTDEVRHELDLARERQESELANQETRQAFVRAQRDAEATLEFDIRRRQNAQQLEQLGALRELGVELTAYLTQARADRVIEFRGQATPQVHLDADDSSASRE
jgi:hypothetical protein